MKDIDLVKKLIYIYTQSIQSKRKLDIRACLMKNMEYLKKKVVTIWMIIRGLDKI